MSNTQSPDIPKWSALLVEAVNKPGLTRSLFRFQELQPWQSTSRIVQCHMRGIQPGPINTFPKMANTWSNSEEIGRRGRTQVRR
jgi:hypothetical protein